MEWYHRVNKRFISFEWAFPVVHRKYKDETLEEIDRLTKEKSDLVDYVNTLKEKRWLYVYSFDHPPPIPVPSSYGYEINNGLFRTRRDILLKQTRNPHLADADLRQIMGMRKRTASYRNHFLFQNRNLPKPHNEPPQPTHVTYPKP
jgi:hypothetical protein